MNQRTLFWERSKPRRMFRVGRRLSLKHERKFVRLRTPDLVLYHDSPWRLMCVPYLLLTSQLQHEKTVAIHNQEWLPMHKAQYNRAFQFPSMPVAFFFFADLQSAAWFIFRCWDRFVEPFPFWRGSCHFPTSVHKINEKNRNNSWSVRGPGRGIIGYMSETV